MAATRYWSAHEISLFLRILHQNNFGPVLFVAGARRNGHAFAHVSAEPVQSGYRRTSAQCRIKFKCLRQSFTKVLMDFGPDPPRRNQSPYWSELKDLWVQSHQPDPAHLFPPGSGPGRNIAIRPLARIRFQAEQAEEAPVEGSQLEEAGGGEEPDIGDDAPRGAVDIMGLPATRAELENFIAVQQEQAERGVLWWRSFFYVTKND
ncbi:hypothetical protein JRQ81_015206 [Phrynocephalus forsythii]|uniref:Myb/SANT-like DNA-binding domain-containing protein n=1 Tax=Phrynocephalus forsythii TaxID=171643 RepID=A0A9Q0XZ41_9SAUR|nr:hypothetical protein JRQ81_015206 [Phrynocephalus forsythii]